jgi:hypothetical protein
MMKLTVKPLSFGDSVVDSHSSVFQFAESKNPPFLTGFF